jgi:hypothetical protein
MDNGPDRSWWPEGGTPTASRRITAQLRKSFSSGRVGRQRPFMAPRDGRRSRLARVDGRNCLSPAYRRFAPIGSCLCKKQLDLFWQKSNILRKREDFNFKIIGIGETPVVILQGPKAQNSINEKGSYHHYLAEPRR